MFVCFGLQVALGISCKNQCGCQSDEEICWKFIAYKVITKFVHNWMKVQWLPTLRFWIGTCFMQLLLKRSNKIGCEWKMSLRTDMVNDIHACYTRSQLLHFYFYNFNRNRKLIFFHGITVNTCLATAKQTDPVKGWNNILRKVSKNKWGSCSALAQTSLRNVCHCALQEGQHSVLIILRLYATRMISVSMQNIEVQWSLMHGHKTCTKSLNLIWHDWKLQITTLGTIHVGLVKGLEKQCSRPRLSRPYKATIHKSKTTTTFISIVTLFHISKCVYLKSKAVSFAAMFYKWTNTNNYLITIYGYLDIVNI